MAFYRNSTTWVIDFRYDGRPGRWFKVFGEGLDPTRQVQEELRALYGDRAQWVGSRAVTAEEESQYLRGEEVKNVYCPTGRLAPAQRFSLEMCSLNMGSMNFSMHPLAERYKQWKFDWEEPYLRESDSYIFRNTFRDIALVSLELGPHSIRFEHECYDVGQLYNLKFCMDGGLFRAPVFIQFVLGIVGGIGADLENLVFMKRTADKLFGNDYRWSVLGAGASQMSLASAAATLGGHARVGLEDSLFIGRGELSTSNAQQVHKVRRMIEELGFDVATPDEAREMLNLKGAA